ncbi:MAG: hypothetical protein RR561_00495 [Peptostreptococcus sp.]|uniref:hypothetical protein n=1 Tax=Peptostreptococcus sp. TaxID=1262 RepID=UPI002FC585A4
MIIVFIFILIVLYISLLFIKLFIKLVAFIQDGSEERFKSLFDAIYNYFYGE